MTDVTQADREEAEALLVHDWFSDDERAIAARAFAKVRLQSRADALAEAAGVAEAAYSDRGWNGMYRTAANFIATAIRALGEK